MTDIEVIGKDYKILRPQIKDCVHNLFRNHDVYFEEKEIKVMAQCFNELSKNESLCKELVDNPEAIRFYVEQIILYLL